MKNDGGWEPKIFNCKTAYVNDTIFFGASSYASDGGLALELWSADDGRRVAKVTICLDYPLGVDEVIIKSYSENEGMLEWLISEGLVVDTGKRVTTGFVECAVVKITEKLRGVL